MKNVSITTDSKWFVVSDNRPKAGAPEVGDLEGAVQAAPLGAHDEG